MALKPSRPLVVALLCALPFLGKAQVVLNEVSASNLSNFADNNGEFEDWVELYNTTAAAVDISGWHLSDNPNNPTKWAFPVGTQVPANGRLMVFCSSRDMFTLPLIFHTNFKLSQGTNETILLADPGGNVMDDFQLSTRSKENHSRGRTTDGAATWSLFQTPTPNAANAGASADYESKPQFSLPAGVYGGAQSVALSSPSGATIRYTLDGTTPTATSTAYAAPLNIATTTVVRAACFSATPGVPPSFIETNTYFIGVTHTVAILSVAGDEVDDLLLGNGGLEPVSSLEYFGPNGVLRDEAVGTCDEHGQDSWAYDQRGFDWVTRDQYGYNDAIHYPIFRTKDRDSFQRLIVKAAAGDNYEFGPGQPTHIRDAYVQALSQVGNLRVDERSYEPCVVYINGQYWGVYDLREKVDDSDFTRYYYDQGEYDIQFIKTWGGTWSEYGGAQAQTDWDAMRNFIATNNMGDPTAFAYVDSLFNWKSLVDYFTLNSYTVCADWLNWNTGWWRGLDPNGDHKKWGYILWDMDATFGHYTNFTGIPDQSPNADPCTVEDLPDPGGQGHTEIIEKLIQENPMVHDYYVNRYIDLGNTLFSCDFMLPFLDSLVGAITPEMPGQIARWGGSMADWQNNVQVLRDFIETRCVTIQDGLIDCYDLSGPYDVQFDVDPPLSGGIQVNSQVLPTYPFTGTYYGGITTTLAPIPEPGWAFSHWTIQNDTIWPSLTDSLVTLTTDTTDRIVAHFIPPIAYSVMLDVEPRNSARIEFDGVVYDAFPTVVQVPEGVAKPIKVLPALYYDFLNWSIKNNYPSPADTTLPELSITFFSPDTVVAHLQPQDYAYWIPNSFTPNNDGINDVWQPWGNVIDLESFDLKIFDRWGQLMFQSNDPNMPWDGTGGGGQIGVGVYAYRAFVIEGITKERHELFGHVTVVR
ncbi:MAG: CotH kinase family protein [Flavobacteriales bacterium]|nr:CotH kinase family protein [Flavobacteriales bacterium]MBK7942281.1 CotH kinase family protein [Flavobacteriales bacterium]MBK9699317.1 CotH kinase family protein [Flavobacteriales bacterium]